MVDVNNQFVQIKTYKVGQRGLRGVAIALPTIWVKRLDVKAGDEIEFLQQPGSDDLVLRLRQRSSRRR